MRSLVIKKDYSYNKLMAILLLTGLGLFGFLAGSVSAEYAKDAPPSTAPINQPVQPNNQTPSGQQQTPGASQNVLEKLTIQVWPEYDDPRVLVIALGEFKDKTNYPQKFLFLAPKEADINSTCSLKPDGTHLSQLYTVTKLEEGREISFNMPEPRFHYEYYYNAFNPASENGQKSFDFSLMIPYPANKVEVEIQQPLKATNFSLNPTPKTSGTDQGGFNTYRYEMDKVAAGQILPIKVSYTKTDPAPSVKKQQGSQGQMNAGGQSGNKSIIIVLMIGAASILALGGYWIISGKKPGTGPVAATVQRNAGSGRSERGGSNNRGTGTMQGGIKFCSSCGARVASSGKFCPNCGVKVRS